MSHYSFQIFPNCWFIINILLNIHTPPNGSKTSKCASGSSYSLKFRKNFTSNNFSEFERVRATTRTFTGFASIWWSVYIKQNVDNQPTIWKDMKAIMRHKFVPPYYRRELLRNLEQLKQGCNNVHAYY